MLPAIAIVVPLYETFLKLHLLGTFVPAIVTFTLFDIPFHVWMMRGFLNEVPRSIEDAARVDGCGPLKTFLRITLPLSRVGVLTSVLFMVIFNWGSYLIPTVLSSGSQQLLPAAVGSAVGAQTINWGQLVSSAVVMTLPLLIIGFFVQRYVVRGLTFGAVK
jgi:multiple sugar transport system permease protein